MILAKTKKGYGMGGAGQSRMTSHQQKKLDVEALREFRDRFHLPLDDDAVDAMAFYKPGDDSAELRYLRARRASLVCEQYAFPPEALARIPTFRIQSKAGFAAYLDDWRERPERGSVGELE